MLKRPYMIIVAVILIVILSGAMALTLAPGGTAVTTANTASDSNSCYASATGDCLQMPSVTGLNLNNGETAFPQALSADYHLVVMPFDREQQVLAVTWLPLFQELSAELPQVQYWSIAALPLLNPAVRLLVLGGMSSGISEADVRTQVTVLFLEDQEAFLDTLEVDSPDAIQVFIMDGDGVIYYRDAGEFTGEKGQALRDALIDIMADN